MRRLLLALALMLPSLSLAAPGVEALTVTPGADGEQTYTLTIQVLLLMTALSVLPAALILMTSFTRIIIVLSILRQALGTAQTPSNQILLGLALFLTFFIMSPVLTEIYETALGPYLADEMSAQAALDAPRWQWTSGKKVMIEHEVPLHTIRALMDKGHEIAYQPNHGAFGHGQIIWRDENGLLCGGTESRISGAVVSW